MRVREFDEFRSPNRKPWLILIVAALVGAALWYRFRPAGGQPVVTPPVIGESDSETAVVDQQEPEPPPPQDVSTALAEAKRLEGSGQVVEARNRYLELLKGPVGGRTRDEIEESAGRINIDLAMSPAPMPEKVSYVVQPGDRVQKIAQKFGTTTELITLSNGLKNPDRIMAGDHLRVLSGPFTINVSRKSNEMVVRLKGEFFKKYRVGTGAYEKTPVGTFRITEKQEEPVWYYGGREIPFGNEDNILGTRWMTLRSAGDTPDIRGYGIHGTWDESSIGKSDSAGWVRMRNREVEELFVLVPRGTVVVIQD